MCKGVLKNQMLSYPYFNSLFNRASTHLNQLLKICKHDSSERY